MVLFLFGENSHKKFNKKHKRFKSINYFPFGLSYLIMKKAKDAEKIFSHPQKMLFVPNLILRIKKLFGKFGSKNWINFKKKKKCKISEGNIFLADRYIYG